MSRSRSRSLQRAAAALLATAVLTLAASCTDDGAAGAPEPPAEVDGVDFTGSGGNSHHDDDGHVVLTLSAHDEIAVHRPRGIETQPLDSADQHLRHLQPGATATFSLSAPGTTFSLEDVEVVHDSAGTIQVSGIPAEAVPPGRFEQWELAVGDVEAAPVDSMSTAPDTASDGVLELDDDEVAAALAAAPPPPSITSVTLVAVGPAPSGFAAELEVRTDDAGRFHIDVNTPGTPDERPLDIVMAVGADDQHIEVVTEDPTGHLTLVAQRPVPGGGAVATLRAVGFDIADVERVSAQVRRDAEGAAPGPWETVLGCTTTTRSFRWRAPGDDLVKVGACPDPHGWVLSDTVTPSLAPDPAAVATAAGFGNDAPLPDHLAALAAAVGVGAPTEGSRLLDLAVSASYPLGDGQLVRIPVLFVQLDAADFDAAGTSAAIDAWRNAMVPPGDLVLQFDVRVGSRSTPRPLLTVRDVSLPVPTH